MMQCLKNGVVLDNGMGDCLNFKESLKCKDEIQYEIATKDGKVKISKEIQEGYSLCKTCVNYLKRSLMPPMCFKNSLEPSFVPDCLKDLTNLEKQLIVKNLIFIKIRQLPKTRMDAMNDR